MVATGSCPWAGLGVKYMAMSSWTCETAMVFYPFSLQLHLLLTYMCIISFSRKPVCVYTFFKRPTIEICLSLFLGLDFNQSDASIITELTTTHWHGKTYLLLLMYLSGAGLQGDQFYRNIFPGCSETLFQNLILSTIKPNLWWNLHFFMHSFVGIRKKYQ